MGKSDVSDDAFAKECGFVCSRSRAVEELVGNDEIGRHILLLKAADSRHRQDVIDTEHLHRIDVCPKGKLTRREFVSPPMSRQKSDRHSVEFTNYKCVRGLAEWRFNWDLPHIFKFRHLVQTAAADDSDVYFFHKRKNSNRIDRMYRI